MTNRYLVEYDNDNETFIIEEDRSIDWISLTKHVGFAMLIFVLAKGINVS